MDRLKYTWGVTLAEKGPKTALLAQVRMQLWRAVTSTERILGSQDRVDEFGCCRQINGMLVDFGPGRRLPKPCSVQKAKCIGASPPSRAEVRISPQMSNLRLRAAMKSPAARKREGLVAAGVRDETFQEARDWKLTVEVPSLLHESLGVPSH